VNPSKDKGTRAETAVVDFLNAVGYTNVERRAQKGGKDEGDIAGIPGTVIEVKASARIALSEFIKELEVEMVNAKADTGVVFVKRRGKGDVGDWYAVTTVRQWTQLAEGAGL
jgi:hypothetical protein